MNLKYDCSLIDMQSANLTLAEIDLLIEALDNLPSRGMAGAMMGSLLGAMISRGDADAQAAHKLDQDSTMDKFEKDKREISAVCSLMKAKLILMRARIEANPC